MMEKAMGTNGGVGDDNENWRCKTMNVSVGWRCQQKAVSGQSFCETHCLQHLTPNKSLSNSMENREITGNGTSGVIIEGEIEKVDQRRKHSRPLGSKINKKIKMVLDAEQVQHLETTGVSVEVSGITGGNLSVNGGATKKRGRPKGSNNKNEIDLKENEKRSSDPILEAMASGIVGGLLKEKDGMGTRKRGGPKRSKNMNKSDPEENERSLGEQVQHDQLPGAARIGVDVREIVGGNLNENGGEGTKKRGRPKGSKNKKENEKKPGKQVQKDHCFVPTRIGGNLSENGDTGTKKRGRPKGSKNRNKIYLEENEKSLGEQVQKTQVFETDRTQVDFVESNLSHNSNKGNKKRGRPKGSRNKNKITVDENQRMKIPVDDGTRKNLLADVTSNCSKTDMIAEGNNLEIVVAIGESGGTLNQFPLETKQVTYNGNDGIKDNNEQIVANPERGGVSDIVSGSGYGNEFLKKRGGRGRGRPKGSKNINKALLGVNGVSNLKDSRGRQGRAKASRSKKMVPVTYHNQGITDAKLHVSKEQEMTNQLVVYQSLGVHEISVVENEVMQLPTVGKSVPGFDEIVSCGGKKNPKGSKHKRKKMLADADGGGNEVEFQLENDHVGPKQRGRNMIQESSKNVHKGEKSTKTQKEIAQAISWKDQGSRYCHQCKKEKADFVSCSNCKRKCYCTSCIAKW